MSVFPRSSFAVRPHDPEGVWETNDGRYRAYAKQLLQEHELHCAEILAKWPIPPDQPIKDSRNYPEINEIGKRRAQTSESTRIYAAMAVEGYLNFYGVLRLGQQVFDEHFERMGLIPKLRALLVFCDHVNIPKNDPLVVILERIARSRNELVHPKAKEVQGDLDSPARARIGVQMPQAAQEAVRDMEAFFEAFVALVPNAAGHIERTPDA